MLKILFEDNHILVCEKPAGIATQSGKITEKDMVSEVNNYLRKAGASSSAYLIHRLDKPVRGILLFAKTKQAASELNKQLTSDVFSKKYYAIVERKIERKIERNTNQNNNDKENNINGIQTENQDNKSQDEKQDKKQNKNQDENQYIEVTNSMYKDGNKAVIVDDNIKTVKDSKGQNQEVKKARLKYRVVSEKEKDEKDILSLLGIQKIIKDNIEDKEVKEGKDNIDDKDETANYSDITVLDITLLTGRFHQIRCQLSNMGHPIMGDSLYGATLDFPKRNAIGLMAYSLSFNHPITKKNMRFEIKNK